MTDDLVYLPVGGDRFQAQVIAAACGVEGIRVELLTGDDGGMNPHLGVQQGHRLLVSVDDAERVRAIVDRQSASPV